MVFQPQPGAHQAGKEDEVAVEGLSTSVLSGGQAGWAPERALLAGWPGVIHSAGKKRSKWFP